MIIIPKCKGFICTTAHPEGCKKNIKNEIDYLKLLDKFDGPKKVLVLGASAGFGLSSRLVSTFCSGASTIGVFYERPCTENKPASAGWYNTASFEEIATEDGHYAKSINGDAFSLEIKEKVINLIKKDLGKIDLVIYSLASPRRTDPHTGKVYNSTLRPIKEVFQGKTIDFHSGNVSEVCINIATEEEIAGTVGVMGGEDWKMWIEMLLDNELLEKGATTMAYSYIGPSITHGIYRDGTIGVAKKHLEQTAKDLDSLMHTGVNGKAYVSVNKALVTQASSAIPVVPLYISILYKVMKEKNIHEECTAQIYRLFKNYFSGKMNTDDMGRLRVDDLELREDVQAEILKVWDKINTENLAEYADIEGYRKSFYKLFGFEVDGVDYEKQSCPMFMIKGLVE